MRSIQAAADIAYKNGSFTDKQIKEIKVRFCLKKSESMAIDGRKGNLRRLYLQSKGY